MSVKLDITSANSATVSVGGLDIHFSYSTPIAFRGSGPLVVRENIWSTTTGKHLNRVDGGSAAAKKERVDTETFERLLQEAIEQEGIPA